MRLYSKMCCGSAVYGSSNMVQPVIRKDFPETWIWESIADKRFFHPLVAQSSSTVHEI